MVNGPAPSPLPRSPSRFREPPSSRADSAARSPRGFPGRFSPPFSSFPVGFPSFPFLPQPAFRQDHLQRAQRVVDAGLDRANRDPQDRRRLVDGPVPQDRLVEYLPVRGDSSRIASATATRRIVSPARRQRAYPRPRPPRSLPAAPSPAMLVDHDTPGDGGKPGHQRGPGGQPAGLAPRPDHGLLHHVLGVLPVPAVSRSTKVISGSRYARYSAVIRASSPPVTPTHPERWPPHKIGRAIKNGKRRAWITFLTYESSLRMRPKINIITLSRPVLSRKLFLCMHGRAG